MLPVRASVRAVCTSVQNDCNGIRLLLRPQVGTFLAGAGAALPQQQLAGGAPGTEVITPTEATDITGAVAELRPHELALQVAEDHERALLDGEDT